MILSENLFRSVNIGNIPRFPPYHNDIMQFRRMKISRIEIRSVSLESCIMPCYPPSRCDRNFDNRACNQNWNYDWSKNWNYNRNYNLCLQVELLTVSAGGDRAGHEAQREAAIPRRSRPAS